ncbi:hypothetical protein [Niallia sp. 01092]|uniref:hypothetical protein n=1 Tax=unclassified Niallia TaxID=2837522 RepID=UPI003FD28B3E
MEIFSIRELTEVIRHVEMEGQGGIFKEETGLQPKNHPKEFLNRMKNYCTDTQLLKKIAALTEDEALHIFVKSVYVVRLKQLETTHHLEENRIIDEVFADYLVETPTLT